MGRSMKRRLTKPVTETGQIHGSPRSSTTYENCEPAEIWRNQLTMVGLQKFVMSTSR